MVETNIKTKLKGHEKFALRDGWLNKGLISVEHDSNLFLGNHGTDELGVGNNMVKSIRYWLKAFGLTFEAPGKGAQLTKLGKLILEYDPYIEDYFTLWILHSNLVKNLNEATTWYLFFNNCELEEFTKDEIRISISNELYKLLGNRSFLESSISDDVDVLLSMYCREKTEDYDPEDKNISPLAGLGLIKKNKNLYLKRQPDLNKLSEWNILYELVNLFEDNRSISIDRISEGEKSVGFIYNLSRVSINEYLDKLENMSYIKVVRTAGLDNIYKENSINDSLEVAREYYINHSIR